MVLLPHLVLAGVEAVRLSLLGLRSALQGPMRQEVTRLSQDYFAYTSTSYVLLSRELPSFDVSKKPNWRIGIGSVSQCRPVTEKVTHLESIRNPWERKMQESTL